MRTILLPKERALSGISQLFGIYERHFAKEFLRSISPGDLVFDVGANFGYFALLASTVNGVEVVAFEPDAALCDEARGAVHANGLNKRITVEATALSNTEGSAVMVRSGSDATGVLTSALQGQPIDEASKTVVPLSTLDIYLKNTQLAPAVMKIDVEGAEFQVLSGGEDFLISYKPTLLLEIHGLHPAQKVWDFLMSLGYLCHIIQASGLLEVRTRDEFLSNFGTDRWKIVHLKAICSSPRLRQ